MAVARCQSCGSPEGLKSRYQHSHPMESPVPAELGLMCGVRGCTSYALLLWLTDDEQRQYLRGERWFPLRGWREGVQVR